MPDSLLQEDVPGLADLVTRGQARPVQGEEDCFDRFLTAHCQKAGHNVHFTHFGHDMPYS